MSLKKIRLELARDHDFPTGSALHGYELVAPVDNDGKLISDEWKSMRDQCRVVRFWGDEEHRIGHLVHKPGGAWAFHYDIHGDIDDDETGYRFDNHRLVVGEYLSLREHDDDRMRTFRICSVENIS